MLNQGCEVIPRGPQPDGSGAVKGTGCSRLLPGVEDTKQHEGCRGLSGQEPGVLANLGHPRVRQGSQEKGCWGAGILPYLQAPGSLMTKERELGVMERRGPSRLEPRVPRRVGELSPRPEALGPRCERGTCQD